ILIYLSYKIIYGTLSLILLVYQIFIRLCATKPSSITKITNIIFRLTIKKQINCKEKYYRILFIFCLKKEIVIIHRIGPFF
ncbi:MAG: hypothetical protein EDM77_10260, partial [Candidatus Jettenia sp. AMX1]